MKHSRWGWGVPIAAGCLWAITVLAGFSLLHGYASTPGRSGSAPLVWPAASGVVVDTTRANLVMLAHPRCPCTRASLVELARIARSFGPRVSTTIVFLKPPGAPAGWEQTGLWRQAASIPGVRVIADDGGEDSRRFGAWTSGHVLLYDGSGTLLFSGGITGARGHEGGNAGSDAVLARLAGKGARERTSIFGCPLFEREGALDREPGRIACRR